MSTSSIFFDDSTDEEYEEMMVHLGEELTHEGTSQSRDKKHRTTIWRNRMEGHQRLMDDYFVESSVYPPHIFRRRFRMNRNLFQHIRSALEAYDPFFVQRRDAYGRLGLSSYEKMTAALCMLAFGVAADLTDEYLRIGESTTILTMKRFVKAVVSIFGDEYLRSPKDNDVARLLAIGQTRGFPGMLGSIDCMHWRWKNYPSAWSGMFTGHTNEPTIILEAVASYDLWIWHAFFGLPGSLNDINVLERSNVFSEVTEGRTPRVNYSINGHDYTTGYYLADGIYPSWSTFVKTIPTPQGPKRKHFAAAQESARKDVERAFGVLQAQFAIVRGPARFFKQETLKDIMTACIILHNMIVEDERHTYSQAADFIFDQIDECSSEPISHDETPDVAAFIHRHHCIRDRETHSQLQSDLVEHLWQLHGDS